MKKKIRITLRVLSYLLVAVITAVSTTTVCSRYYLHRAYACYDCDWEASGGTTVCGLSYGPDSLQTYDLYLPADTTAHALILFIHGGGFTGGDKEGEQSFCHYYTSKGYVCASPNYTLLTGKSGVNLNTMYTELLQCVAAIKAECAQRGYTLTAMATSGQSAGGCLAMMLAYRGGDTCAVPVRCVFEHTGPADFDPVAWGINDVPSQKAFVGYMTGTTPTDQMIADGSYRRLTDEISPVALARRHYVPTIMAYGPKDKLVPVNLKFPLIAYMKGKGLPHEYIEFPNSGHGLLADPERQTAFRDKSLEYCKKYLQ